MNSNCHEYLRQMLWNIANFASTNKNYDVHSSVLALPWYVQLVGNTLSHLLFHKTFILWQLHASALQEKHFKVDKIRSH